MREWVLLRGGLNRKGRMCSTETPKHEDNFANEANSCVCVAQGGLLTLVFLTAEVLIIVVRGWGGVGRIGASVEGERQLAQRA